jgi:hypothetical protein
MCASAKMRAWAKKRDVPRAERWVVRIVVAGLSLAVVSFALNFTIPPHATGHNRMPSIALGQPDLYRAEVCLALLYAGLLLLMALFYGVSRGTLPVEISQLGAKWPQAASATNVTLDGLDAAVKSLQRNSPISGLNSLRTSLLPRAAGASIGTTLRR